MVLGYQSACQEWDRRRRNVAAYTVSLQPLILIVFRLSDQDLMKSYS